jgi:hypothetical protein
MNVENIESVQKVNDYDDTLCNYKVICKDSDSRVYLVPLEAENTDYQAILEWVADGNTIADAD